MNVDSLDTEEDTKQAKNVGTAEKHLQPESKECKDEEGEVEVAHPVASFTSAQVKAEAKEEEEITNGDNTLAKHNDGRAGNSETDDKDWTGGDCSDGEEEDFNTTETTEKREDKMDIHPFTGIMSSHITSKEYASEGRIRDVTRGRDTERRSSTQKEEHVIHSKDHHGEGDASCPDKKAPGLPTVKAQDTYYSKPLLFAIFIAILGVLIFWFLKTEPPSVQKEKNLVDVFRHEMDKVESNFPNQRKELWRRSRIHLQRHLNMSSPSEPVSLILTAGHRAEKTLGCLAQRLASAFSTTLNASAIDIDGTSKTTQDSDQVKLDIDRILREAFDDGKQAAVIHRFEKLPPGSTLIFYRYCDHENAAYKRVFLAFTVLLEEELEVPSNVSLGKVEEIVQEYLKAKFVSSERTTMFNQMDVDKLSGLWSRISHLILPVAAEKMIEQHGCEGLSRKP